MNVSRRVLARHIATRLAAGENRSEILEQLAAFLLVHKQTGQLELVVADIVRNLAGLGTVKANAIVARPLTAELRREVEAYVKRIEAVDTVQIEEIVRPELLGGIIIETPNKRFDASVTTQLNRLRNV